MTCKQSLPVRGIQFEGREQFAEQMQLNDPVILEPEPDNPYDSTAVKILNTPGKQIGYIPAEHSQTVTQLIEENKILKSYISTKRYNYNTLILSITIEYEWTDTAEFSCYENSNKYNHYNKTYDDCYEDEKEFFSEFYYSYTPPRNINKSKQEDSSDSTLGCLIVIAIVFLAIAILAKVIQLIFPALAFLGLIFFIADFFDKK